MLFVPFVGDISDDVSRKEFLRAISDEIIVDVNQLRGLTWLAPRKAMKAELFKKMKNFSPLSFYVNWALIIFFPSTPEAYPRSVGCV